MKKNCNRARSVDVRRCHPRSSEGRQLGRSQDAIKALGSTVPSTQFDRSFWQHQHDANSPAWSEAKRLCEQTVLANYPNCLPVNDIVQADQQKKAEAGNKAAEPRSKKCSGDGYRVRRRPQSVAAYRATCRPLDASIRAYPKIRQDRMLHGNAQQAASIPKGIPDPKFQSREESEMPPTQFGVFQDVLTQFQTVTVDLARRPLPDRNQSLLHARRRSS